MGDVKKDSVSFPNCFTWCIFATGGREYVVIHCTSSSPLSIQIHVALGSNVHIIHAAGNADDAGPMFRLPDLRLVLTSGASKMETKLETLQAAIGALGKRI